MTQIIASSMENTLQLFHGNSACLRWLNKETLWPLLSLEMFSFRSPRSANVSARLFEVTCNKVSAKLIHRNSIVDVVSLTKHILLSHLCSQLMDFYPI